MSATPRMTPRPPQRPSGISVGKIQTLGATASNFPPSARIERITTEQYQTLAQFLSS
jgi:hypothetical protein